MKLNPNPYTMAIRLYVRHGGGMVGVCAGAYLGCTGRTRDGQRRLDLLSTVAATRQPRGKVNLLAMQMVDGTSTLTHVEAPKVLTRYQNGKLHRIVKRIDERLPPRYVYSRP